MVYAGDNVTCSGPCNDANDPYTNGDTSAMSIQARADLHNKVGPANYEVQICTGDPNVAANWSYKGSFSGGKAVLDGLTVGSNVWGRVRKIGTGGEVGDWSDPAQTMVT